MAFPQGFSSVDAALVAGGALFILLSSLVWRTEARTRDALRTKTFEGDTRAPLEQMYVDSHSFRGLYVTLHDFVNQPPFMVAVMILIPVVAILIGVLYVYHSDLALPFMVVMLVLGLAWYFGDALESALVISYAAKSSLRKSDRDNVTRYREMVRLGKFYLMALGFCLVASSLLDGAGLVTYIARPWGVMAVAAAIGLAFSAGWRTILSANRPVP